MLKISISIMILMLLPITANCLEYENNYDEDWDYASEQKQKCSKGNMIELNFCLGNEFKKSDTELNQVYKTLSNALKNPEPLKNTQRAWVKFRDLHCEFIVPSSSEGSEIPYSRNACLIDITEKRILDLKQIWPCNGCVEFKYEFYRN